MTARKIRRTHAPLRDWRRRHPAARALASLLLRHPGMLRLRTRLIAADLVQMFAVSRCTAMTAIGLARRGEVGAL